jgi:uncharacterized membrane protein
MQEGIVDFLGPFHPQITHFPIVLIIVSLLFEVVGRLTDLDWWRKAAFVLLLFGVLGAGAAVLSGNAAEEGAEVRHVPEAAIEAHEEAAYLTLWLGLGAVLARLVAGRVKKARALAGGIALALQLAAAVVVGVTGHRGGELVFRHGAGVQFQGPTAPAGEKAGEAAPATGQGEEKDKD